MQNKACQPGQPQGAAPTFLQLISGVLAILLLTFSQLSSALESEVDFSELAPPHRPNYYLISPAWMAPALPHEVSPDFAVPASVLYELWEEMLAREKRVTLKAAYPESGQYVYREHSFMFRFPDFITVQFFDLPNKQSTLAIYSRARYGYFDFNVNKKRIDRWLAQLDRRVAKHLAPPQKRPA